ncbi:MAG: bifunctional adenosylcobinamide kinase/adenosylcobinamide-phosphate guanylyltransferase, partial [Desulfamplus sp.]|nr:bifunctional adenosylcobinamide kinase/adenosylcobinamide-phosphate guanylyltransferase [Desulfamplus sp.]
ENRVAENRIAVNQKFGRKIFIATSMPTDREMEDRVTKHQKERGNGWDTAEVPVDISAKIKELSMSGELATDLILVDCLTLWVSNLMFHDFDENGILRMTEELQNTLKNSPLPVFLVSNEVGSGIVPENALARKFRDMAGMVNQKIAQIADQVIYMVAGIPVNIKL